LNRILELIGLASCFLVSLGVVVTWSLAWSKLREGKVVCVCVGRYPIERYEPLVAIVLGGIGAYYSLKKLLGLLGK